MEQSKDWVLKTIEDINRFGKTDKGITRLALTCEEMQAREYMIGLMKESGLSVRLDPMGNVIGRLEGLDESAPAVATGSHLDTVPQGGKYDGVVGVVGGIAAINALKKRGALTHPVELIVFMAEESSRFGFATMGSKAMAGKVNDNTWARAIDKQGITFMEALKNQGFDSVDFQKIKRNPTELKAFIELHIEQGRILEADNQTIGIVQAIAAPTRLKVKVEGCADHSGATPMYQRKDALASAAELILAIEDIAIRHGDEGTVGTVGALNVEPGAMNVVPGLVTMWVDIRGVDYESIMDTLNDFKEEVVRVADERDTLVVIDVLSSDKPVGLNDEVVRVIEDACQKFDIDYCLMNSGAGHDAMNMAAITPTGMIFIPCKNGVSHNPEEYASIDDIYKGIEVLTEALYNLAK